MPSHNVTRHTDLNWYLGIAQELFNFQILKSKNQITICTNEPSNKRGQPFRAYI